MAKKKEDQLKLRGYVYILLIVLLIIIIFTFFDYLIHSLSEEYAVPDYYFRNKVIFGTGIGFISYLLVRKKNLLAKSLIFSLIISGLLQIRYFLEGFPLKFVLEFLLIHFLILFIISLIIFKLLEKLIVFNKTNERRYKIR